MRRCVSYIILHLPQSTSVQELHCSHSSILESLLSYRHTTYQATSPNQIANHNRTTAWVNRLALHNLPTRHLSLFLQIPPTRRCSTPALGNTNTRWTKPLADWFCNRKRVNSTPIPIRVIFKLRGPARTTPYHQKTCQVCVNGIWSLSSVWERCVCKSTRSPVLRTCTHHLGFND